MIELTDTHCHLYLPHFDSDRQEVLARARAAGVNRILIPGLDLETSQAAVHLAESDPYLFAAVGFHPAEPQAFEQSRFERLARLADHPKVVAIGEIGLDYYWVKDPLLRSQQHHILRLHLSLAEQVNKPLVLHLREEDDRPEGPAMADLLALLSEWHDHLLAGEHPLATRPGVLHAFPGTVEMAQPFLERHFRIGIAGPVTYKKAESKRDLVRRLPRSHLLLETDAPFLAPFPYRGKRNEPALLREIADKIAETTSQHLQEVAAQTTQNAARLFLW